MFCGHCAAEVLSSAAKYCYSCGKELTLKADEQKTTKLSFEDFRKRKGEDRTSKFTNKKKMKEENASKKIEESEVTVQIGVMFWKDGELMTKRGCSLPLKVNSNSNAENLKCKAVSKQNRFNAGLVRSGNALGYKLLYQDRSEVLPSFSWQADLEFSLAKYKEELGKPYSRITFYVCSNMDYLSYIRNGIASSDDTDDSGDSLGTVKPKSSKTDLTLTAIKQVDKSSLSPGHSSKVNTLGHPSTITVQEPAAVIIPDDKVNTLGHPSTITVQEPAAVIIPDDKDHEVNNSNPNIKTLRDMFPNKSSNAISSAWKEGNESLDECINILLSQSSSDVQLLQDVYASCFASPDDNDEDSTHADLSKSCSKIPITDNGCLKEALQEVVNNFQEDALRIKVRRHRAWRDTMIKLENNESNLNRKFKVQFVGEPAIDEGGPKRELFCLIDRKVMCELMVGPDGKKTFQHNIMSLRNNEYYRYGQAVAMGLIQGSPGPRCFSKCVTDYILFENFNTLEPTSDEVPDMSVRMKLQELESIADSDKFEEEASYNFPERFDAGYCKFLVQSPDKEELSRCVSVHYIISSCQAELGQFLKGLQLHGVLDILRANPHQGRKLLQGNTQKLTAEIVDGLFEPELSPIGNNKREHEEAILFNFSSFLEDVGSGCVHYAGEKEGLVITLESVLSFITGATNIPAIGFDVKPKIAFDHQANEGRKLIANTCINTLTFPVTDTYKDSATFKKEIVSCLQDCQGFGNL